MMNRRDFLRTGGLAASAAAVLAACGNTAGPTAPGRLGVAGTDPTLPDGTVNEVVYLRTLESLHHTMVDIDTRLLDAGDLPADWIAALTQIRDNHLTAADTLGQLVEAAGGVSYQCENPFWLERFIEPAFAATEGSDDLVRDHENIALVFEEIVARSHQAMLLLFTNAEHRATVLDVGLGSARQAAYLAALAHPDPVVNPTLTGGDAAESDGEGFPIYYAIPASFGQVDGITLTVGPVDETEGTRQSLTLDTPADNSFIYEYMECG